MSDYEFRSFRVGRESGGRADAATTGWLEASALGFLEAPTTPEHARKVVGFYEADDWLLSGAYLATSPAEAWNPSHPVATYGVYDKTLNVGDGRLLPVHLIAGVTVRSTHRRRGLMRELVERDLRQAASDGIPIAALFAMEATIYGRFGFGPATVTQRIEVDAGSGFGLRVAPRGTVEIADAATLVDLSPTVFGAFHAQTLGSVDRPAAYPTKMAGLWAEDAPSSDTSVRAALHYDESGTLDGYVSYRFLGWDTLPRTLEIVDIVALSTNAYLGLWEYLASSDIVDRVRLEHAPLDDPLRWAMTDSRGCAVTGQEDGLWLRILDPVAALTARSYETDGRVRFALTDSLGIADGVYTLTVRGGEPRVERSDGTARSGAASSVAAELTLDVADLGSLYLGAGNTRMLAAAGRIDSTSLEALDTLGALLAHREQPLCITHF
jgi:predicted acetyltransferase